MDLRQQKRLRQDYLVTHWEMHGGNYGGDVSNKAICAAIGIDYDTDATIICQFLRGEEFITWSSFESVHLEPKGRLEAERIMEERYAEKETRVLRKIYDMSKQDTTRPVGFHEIEPDVGLAERELSGICKGLEEQRFIEWPGGDYVQITREGIRAIDDLGKSKPPLGGDTYQMNVHTIHGPVQQGSGNVQNIQITNNPDFDQAMAGLLQLIEASRLPADEIEELRDEVTKLNKLALSEPKPGLLERAKARIDVMKVSFEGAKLLVQAAPYLHTAWEYFKAKHS
jgi:hypothetical protein